ncbi:MAG: nucleotide exchange factor GrpE, partial [Actinomycetota bacterium]|nr:nucleotide exchange factor GrpE [Actinomycetota bacterium]
EQDQPAGGTVGVDETGLSTASVPAGASAQAAELEALQAQLDERTGDLQRISAEYSNYRRRVDRDRQLVIAVAKAQVVGQLLTVLDDIERAQQHGDLSGAFKAVAEKLVAALQGQGLEPFGAIGEGFDPVVHEAVQHNTGPDVDKPTVTAVLRRGYRLGDRVLRPAMVAVTDAEGGTGSIGGPPGGTEPLEEPLEHPLPDPLGDTASFGDPEQLRDN